MPDELKSCPFCGADEIETFYNRSGVDHYTCQYCGASAKNWNSRHESDVVERMRNLLEDVVNALNLSDVAIETHGPLGTEPAELVKLVLQQKDREIALLHHEPDDLIRTVKTRINELEEQIEVNCTYRSRELVNHEIVVLKWVLSLKKE